MELVDQIIEQVRRLLAMPTAELTRAQASVRYMIDLGRHGARELHHDRATQMAAALTYHTLFSLLPTLVLMLVVMRVFVTDVQLDQFKESTIGYIMQWLSEATAGMAVGAEAVATGSRQEDFAQTAAALRENLQKWMKHLQDVSFGSIGVAGVLLFIYAATGLLATTERSFNQVYGAPHSRPWYIRLPMYYTVITLGPLLIVLGQLVQGRLFDLLVDASWTRWLVGPLAVITPLLATWLVLFAMYTLLPNTHVRLRPAMIGSFIAALGWVFTIELFGLYVRGAASTTLYGALAVLPLFLLWLWITWLIVLFGLELTYTLQAMRGRNFKSAERAHDADLFVDPKWLIPVMALIGRRFENGESTRLDTVARATSLPLRAAGQLVEHLMRAGLVNRVEAGETSDPGYAPALPPERIELRTLLETGRRLSLERYSDGDLPGGDLLDLLSDAEQRAAGDRTLASVLSPAAPGVRSPESRVQSRPDVHQP